MVRDEKGLKMSKTRGNVIDPLDITQQQGADALRFTLTALTAQGRDIKLAKERIEGYRAFANKLWNASRFTFMNLAGYRWAGEDPAGLARTPADRWILARLQRAVNETLDALEAYRFNDAAGTVYQFVWHELCDWYIELSKEALYGEQADKKRGAQAVLAHCLDVSLRLLHPVMPFITEELWQTLKSEVGAESWAESIMIAPYPGRAAVDEAGERSFGPVIGIIDALRNIRGEMNIPFKTVLRDIEVGALGVEAAGTLEQERGRILRLANAEGLRFLPAGQATLRRAGCAVGVGSGFEVRVPLAGVVDMAAETARIEKEMVKVEADLASVEGKLANPSFVEKAPAEVVEKDRARAEELRERRRKLEAHRALLAGAEEEEPGGPGPSAATRTSATWPATTAATPTATPIPTTTRTTATPAPATTPTATTTTTRTTPTPTATGSRKPQARKKPAPGKKAKAPARRGAGTAARKSKAGRRPPPKRGR